MPARLQRSSPHSLITRLSINQRSRRHGQTHCNRSSEGREPAQSHTDRHRLPGPRWAHAPTLDGSPSPTLTVSVCVNGLHEEGISRVQALLQAGFGVLRSSGVQACWDRLMSAAPFLSAAGTLMDTPHTSWGSPSWLVPRVFQQGPKGERTSPGPLNPETPHCCLQLSMT